MSGETDGSVQQRAGTAGEVIYLRVLQVTAARPCRAGVPTQSPVAGAPAVPRSGVALDPNTAQFGSAGRGAERSTVAISSSSVAAASAPACVNWSSLPGLFASNVVCTRDP
jgi:hypothetical protein